MLSQADALSKIVEGSLMLFLLCKRGAIGIPVHSQRTRAGSRAAYVYVDVVVACAVCDPASSLCSSDSNGIA